MSYGVYMLVYETGLRNLHWNHVFTTLISGGTAGKRIKVPEYNLPYRYDEILMRKLLFPGVVSWAVITPIDLVKSRIQADDIKKPVYNGVIDCFRKSYRSHGLPVFFRGFSMMMLRSFPVNAATFSVYESALHVLEPDANLYTS